MFVYYLMHILVVGFFFTSWMGHETSFLLSVCGDILTCNVMEEIVLIFTLALL